MKKTLKMIQPPAEDKSIGLISNVSKTMYINFKSDILEKADIINLDQLTNRVFLIDAPRNDI